jgi:hypothetical protein
VAATDNCCVCLFAGTKTEAVTIVKGYAVCQPHLSLKEAFFRTWEATQDPKQLSKKEKKRMKKGGQ